MTVVGFVTQYSFVYAFIPKTTVFIIQMVRQLQGLKDPEKVPG